MNVIIITPARDEEHYIEETLKSMVNQTVLPAKWIIVDDGSKDKTAEIVKKYTQQYSFIEFYTRTDRGFRKPGGGVVATFYEGLNRVDESDYDVIAKLDADLKLPVDMIEKIIKSFQQNPKLGITGGIQYESFSDTEPLKKMIVPKGYVLGPQKFYRKECFEDIGGLIERAGWDGVDITRANMKGWETGQIESLKVVHLRSTGTAKGEGRWKACQKYGDVSYYMGGYLWYFLLRCILRSIEHKTPKYGYYMLKGYYRSWKEGYSRESRDFRQYLKKTQLKTVFGMFY